MSAVLRRTRHGESYELECWKCHNTAELPTTSDGTYCCPNCQAQLHIDWYISVRPSVEQLLPPTASLSGTRVQSRTLWTSALPKGIAMPGGIVKNLATETDK